MSKFNDPIVVGYTGMQDTKGWNQTPAQRMQIPESQSELEPLQQDECSVFPLLESTQPAQEVLFGPQGAGGEFFPDLQFYCSPDKREFPIPILTPGIASCKIHGRSFKTQLEPRPLYIQEYSLLCLRVIPWFVGCLSSSLLI